MAHEFHTRPVSQHCPWGTMMLFTGKVTWFAFLMNFIQQPFKLKREVLYKCLVQIHQRNRDKLTESHTVLEMKSIKVLKTILHWLNKKSHGWVHSALKCLIQLCRLPILISLVKLPFTRLMLRDILTEWPLCVLLRSTSSINARL